MKNISFIRIFSVALITASAIFNLNAQISGTVFRDYNANGVKDNTSSYSEPGIGGITISVYNSSNALLGTIVSCEGANLPSAYCISNNIGYYEMNVPAGNYRVEFSWNMNYLYNGASGGTSVQFVTAPVTNVNFGLNNPSHYSQPAIEQEVVTPRFAYGYYNSSNFGSTPAIIGIPYNSQDPTSNIGIQNPAVVSSTAYALFNQVGTTMGLAWQRTTSNLYAGAFMHRHSGFGPAGTGGVYIVNKDLPINDPNKVKIYADLNAIFGANTAGADPHPQTQGGNWFNDVRDPANSASWSDSWNTVGKIGLGDVELSDDETTLYVVNLADRQLYVLPADPALAGSLTTTQIQRYPIPLNWCVDNTASNTTDDSRPFALKFYDGKLYVAVTCTGESLTDYNVADVGVAIYEFTGSGFSAQPVFTIDGVNFTSPQGGAILFNWRPWQWGGSGTGFNPNAFRQFWLTDIELDNGDLQLGVRDRWGDLVHFNAGLPTPSNTGLTPANNVQATTMGKSFRACLDRNDSDGDGNRNEWILESTGQCGGISGAGHPTAVAWTPGPGGSVFYHEYAAHAYPGTGGLLQLPGFLEMAETTMGPTGLNSGGINWMNNFGNTAGQNTRGGVSTPVGATLYDGFSAWPGGAPSNPNPWFKSAGLGDIEALSIPAPFELGNRVWNDTNANGIQDAGEAGIAGVQVQLLKNGSVISTATTDANGNYIFSSGIGTSTTSFKYGISQLTPNADYIIRVPTTTGGLILTTANAGSKNIIDSDAPSNGEVPVLASEIPISGANNHTFDIGYSLIECSLTSVGKTNEACNNNNTGSDPADDYITFSLNPTGTGLGTGYTVSVNGGATITPVSGNYGTATNFRLQNGSANGTLYTITITDGASSSCTITTTVQQNSCSAACSMVDDGLCNINCSNTGSDNTNSNDYIIFDLNPIGVNLGSGYNVTVSTGTVTLANGSPATNVAYGSTKSFRLQNGSAGAGNVTITVTDSSNPACTLTLTLTDPGSCSTTCPGAYMLGAGESYTFTTQTSNIDVNTIQWYKSTDGGSTFTPIPAAQGGTSQSITINTIGQYYYVANGLDGCRDSSCCHIIIIPSNCDNCQLLSSGKSNDQCNNNNTPLNGADDYITFSLNPVGSLTGTTYNVTVNNGGSITPSSGTYGVATSFRLQNGSANGTLYTITITDGSDNQCTITTTVQMDPCTVSCNLSDAGKSNQQCNNNGTGSTPSDDYITFTLNPVGSNIGTLYFVTVNNGGIITPSQGAYGSPTTFRLQNGSANGTTYTITLTDNVSPTCQVTTTLVELSCSNDCQLNNPGKSNEQCNNNNTSGVTTDDYITFSLNPTGLNLGSGYTVTVSNGGTITPTSGTYGSATSFRLQNGSANGTTYTITVTDNATGACQVTTTVMMTECSDCPPPDCLNVQMKKN